MENGNSKLCKVVNKYKDEYDVYIGRGSKWGNPFQMKDSSQKERDRVCDEYEKYIVKQDNLMNDIGRELYGKTLGCFCKPKRCHGDFLKLLADKGVCEYCNHYKNTLDFECIRTHYIQNCYEHKK